jgi:hypothetical protein
VSCDTEKKGLLSEQMVKFTQASLAKNCWQCIMYAHPENMKLILPVRPYFCRKANVVATSQSYLSEKQRSMLLNPVGYFANSFLRSLLVFCRFLRFRLYQQCSWNNKISVLSPNWHSKDNALCQSYGHWNR